MPRSQVKKIVRDENGNMTVTVEVYGFTPESYVHVTGYATQIGGAFATFETTKQIVKEDADPPPAVDAAAPQAGPPAEEDGVDVDVKVELVPPGSKPFGPTEPIAVVATAASVWMSVLEPQKTPGTTSLTGIDAWAAPDDSATARTVQ
jgi:hypothetical protein